MLQAGSSESLLDIAEVNWLSIRSLRTLTYKLLPVSPATALLTSDRIAQKDFVLTSNSQQKKVRQPPEKLS